MRESTLIMLLATLGLAACGSPEPANDATANAVAPGALPEDAMAANMINNSMASNAAMAGGAKATLRTAKGADAGTVEVSPGAVGLTVKLSAQGLPPGDHGVHIHMTGKCESPKFESAGGHWNPANAKHGLENPAGQHAGDMPNLIVGADGKGTLSYALKGGSLAELLDADGAAFVVHAKVDDQKTDPSGDSGDRIACGVFAAG